MKCQVLLFFFSLGYFTAYAQVAPVYFQGDRVTANKERATSYAIYGKLSDQEIWAFKRYDLYNNLIQTGAYKDEQLSVPHGTFTFYMDIDDYNQLYSSRFKLAKGQFRFVSQKGNFANGVEDGRWFLYFPDGNVMNYQDFVNGKLHGEFVTLDRLGKILIKGNYVDGEKDGKWILEGNDRTAVYEKGKLIATFKGNKSEGPITRPVKEKAVYQFVKPSKQIPNQIPNRKHEFFQEIETFNDRHGTSFPSEVGEKYLSEQGNIVNNLEEGLWTAFYPNGKVMFNVNFVKGKLNGEYVSYDLNDKISVKGNYIDGLKNGTWIEGNRTVNYEKGKPIKK
jgi:antitoxin component YwqK of YwqJK toxin-antitoxin module